jgi:hypothetical protein
VVAYGPTTSPRHFSRGTPPLKRRRNKIEKIHFFAPKELILYKQLLAIMLNDSEHPDTVYGSERLRY